MALHFILDGYNLIKQDEKLSALGLQAGRDALLKMLSTQNLTGSERNQITVVFDGQDATTTFFQEGITVIFAGYETADDRIKQIVEDTASPKTLVVVTDDKEIRYFVRALGAGILATKEFLGRAKQKTLPKSEKNISSAAENKITDEMARLWLKKKDKKT